MAAVTDRSIPMPLGAALRVEGNRHRCRVGRRRKPRETSRCPDAGQRRGRAAAVRARAGRAGTASDRERSTSAPSRCSARRCSARSSRRPFLDPVLSMGLFTLVVLGSTLKVHLPVPGTIGDVVGVVHRRLHALILVGPEPGHGVRGHRRRRPVSGQPAGSARCALYRVLFSMSALVITVQVTHLVYSALGGQTGIITPQNLATPVVGGAFAYFVCNAILVALATSLATGQSAWQIWTDAFCGAAPASWRARGWRWRPPGSSRIMRRCRRSHWRRRST